MPNNCLSKRIKQALFDANLNQRELSRKVGVSETHVSNWICGHRNPRLKNLKKISQLTHKPLSYFLDDANTIVEKDKSIVSKELLEIELLKKEVENLKLKVDLIFEKLKK
jgi:transcriptional regulator with XRE-family HTH domain